MIFKNCKKKNEDFHMITMMYHLHDMLRRPLLPLGAPSVAPMSLGNFTQDQVPNDPITWHQLHDGNSDDKNNI